MPRTRDDTTSAGRADRGGPAGGAPGGPQAHADPGARPSGGAGPRRRSLLAGAAGTLGAAGAAGLVAGCSGSATVTEKEQVDAARRLRRAAFRDSAVLLVRYDSTASAHPSLARRLRPLRGDIARHLAALEDVPDPGAEGRGKGSRSAVPPDEKGALAALAAAERRTADARTRDLLDAPPELARLLASLAASGSVHALLLTERAA